MASEAADKYRYAQYQLTSEDVDVNSLHMALTDLMDLYNELNNAISWDTTCLNCSKLLDQLYDRDVKLEKIERIISDGPIGD